MKNITLLALAILIPFLSFSQNFEGTLTYLNDVEIAEKFSEQFGMTKEKLIETGQFFEEMEITYKDNNYLVSQSNSKTKVVYNPERNEILTIDRKSDLVTAIKAGIDLQTETRGISPKITVEDTEDMVMNIKCSKVVVEWEMGTYEYYFNSEYLKMDPELYSNHKYDMWSEFLKLSNALPLKIVKIIPNMMTITMTLNKIDEHSVNDKVFKLPKLKLSEEFTIDKGNQVYYEKQ
ncbi:hypothetical protein [Winogradskyella sp. SYSU M77433]|uniref:hypothetical protein n=1 Tax=Winogradskyella sp. SYSU M77433 TaxID=3042722 RepID=UPI002480101D|nr:hypothetical protein [Winogradskyella sp. SYSU M77433]MDH7913039.1 hypothetical protein [Winogradskyella sp. SYSU M77433]|tara:strand:- start:820 stop:1521 length:702 start_codon:yes stop_codon:yes gene_type:complete